MPGMLRDDQIDALRTSPTAEFDVLFVLLMSYHHAGAATMSDEQLHRGGDIRLKIMAQAIRHSQQGEIELMRGTQGFSAVGAAITNSLTVRFTPDR